MQTKLEEEFLWRTAAEATDDRGPNPKQSGLTFFLLDHFYIFFSEAQQT